MEIELRRVACRRCGAVKRERLAWLVDNPRYTRRFAFYVGRRCRAAAIADIAEELRLEWHTVKELEMQYMREQLRRAGTPAPEVIGIDQVSIRPTVLGRSTDDEIRQLIEGHGYEVFTVAGDDPPLVHQALAGALETCYAKIRAIQSDARQRGVADRPRWPAIVLRTPKGWTGPKVVDGLPIEGTFRAHQVPLAEVKTNPAHLQMLEACMKSYRPQELFDDSGRLMPALAALAPPGDRRMGANPHANGGKELVELDLPDFRDYALPVKRPATERAESTRELGKLMRDVFLSNAGPANFRLFCPDETTSNRLADVFEVQNRCFVGRIEVGDDHLATDGRVMDVLSEHNCQGWLEGYTLTGRHGLFASYEALLARAPRFAAGTSALRELCQEMLVRHETYTRAHLEDLPEVRDWTWT